MVDYVKVSDEEKKQKKKPTKISFKKILLVALGLFILSSIISSISYSLTPKIGVVPITGMITTQSENSIVSGSTISSRAIADQLYSLESDNSVKAILLDINSPGGSAVATEEISTAVERVAETKPVYALINDVGASGAFWIAVSANKTYASPMSTLGSIGVTSATLSFEEFIEEYNVSYRRLTAGEFKDIGSPYREMTNQEEVLIEDILNQTHQRFIDHIATRTNVSNSTLETYTDGRIFLGTTAKDVGFIDELGYYPDVIDDMKNGSQYLVVDFPPRGQVYSLFGIEAPSFFPKTYAPLWFMS